MYKTLALALVLSLMPIATHAEEVVDPSSASQTAPVVTGTQGDASSLMPGATSSNTNAASSADGGVLQPAGNSPLQSRTDDSTGLVAPVTDPLQAQPQSDTELRVLLDAEADGPQHDTTDQPAHTIPLWLELLLGLLLLGVLAAGWRLNRTPSRPVSPPSPPSNPSSQS